MTKVAIWCRHEGDNIIGIGPQIPWHIPSDFKRFRKITEGQNLVVGEKTYESFPNRTLPNRDIFILTLTKGYEVSDKEHHFVHHDIKDFKDIEEDLYICGGATIYKLFMSSGEKLMPDIIVDSVYCGEIDKSLQGEAIEISFCTKIMEEKYFKLDPPAEQDNVKTSIWIKRGDFVDQTILKNLISSISVNY